MTTMSARRETPVTTGAAGIQQSSSNLDTLLHPQQSTRRPQMVIHLDPAKVNTASARSVIEHVRGRVIATTMGSFLRGTPETLAPMVGRAARCMEVLGGNGTVPTDAAALVGGHYGFRSAVNAHAMVWHNVTVDELVQAVRNLPDPAMVVPLWEDGQPWFYVTSRLLMGLRPSSGASWQQPLPALSALLHENWPSVADVFCAPGGRPFSSPGKPLT